MEILLPAMGEGITDATITKWLVNEGAEVEADQPMVEIATDKVDSEIPAPEAGVLKKIFAKEGDVPKVGEVIALLEVAGEEHTETTAVSEPDQTTTTEELREETVTDKAYQDESTPAPSEPQPAIQNRVIEEYKSALKDKFISPYIRNLAKANNISLKELVHIQGTGSNKRLTKHDILNYLNQRTSKPAIEQFDVPSNDVKALIEEKRREKKPGANGESGHARYEIVEMDRMRKLIAQHMVQSVQTSPHVTSFAEADLTNLVRWRNSKKQEFQQKYNQKLTLTTLFIDAITRALKDFPMINVSVDEDKIIVKKDINIGMATALTNGNLIVPVIKNADQLTLQGIAAVVNDLAERARLNKLRPEEIRGGTFTLTNVGTFGNITGTPIINQPEVAIMAAGSITRKPAVVKTPQGESIGIRDMIILSLTYDHRVVDGSLGGSFLKRVADYLEDFDVKRDI